MQLAAHRQQRILDHMVELFEHDDLIEPAGEILRSMLGERKRHADLHEPVCRHIDAGCMAAFGEDAQSLAHVHRAHAARHDAELRSLALLGRPSPLNRVERRERPR